MKEQKEIYKEILNETLGSFPLFFDSKDKKIKQFSIEASNKVTDLHRELLIELEKL
jgi:hypothetical protein